MDGMARSRLSGPPLATGNLEKARGFTLPELLVASAVASIVLAIAIPSFDRLLAQNRLAVAANEVQFALMSARQLAINYNVPVTFCAGNRESGCHGLWSDGEWIVFIDRDRDGVIDDDDLVRLASTSIRSDSISLSANGAFRTAVVFGSTGEAETRSGAFAAGRVRVCTNRVIDENASDLVLIGTGRAVLEHHDFAGECPAAGV